MGDISEMMLDGTLCEQCGEYLGADTGYPTLCGACQAENQMAAKQERKAENIARHEAARKAKCPICGKKVKEAGVKDHLLDVHGRAS